MARNTLIGDAPDLRPTFLLVDDDERNLDVLEALLVPLGGRCVRANDGATALGLAPEVDPDLMILDLSMPGLDGVDVLLHVRGTPALRDTPVVVVTGHAEREQRLRALKAGADDFLEKPVDQPVLLARIGTLLRLKRSRDAVIASNAETQRVNALLEERHRALLAAELEKRELQAFIVHDLKSPLTALGMDIDWIRNASEDEGIRTAAADAATAVRRLQEMIEDLLTVARIDAPGGLELAPTPFPVRELFSEVTHLHARTASARGITVEASAPTEARVVGDRKLLLRALDNLLDNALRHTPRAGRVVLGCELASADEVAMAVANSGAPVPATARARLFDRFVRAEGERASRSHVGLGLYFCKRVVDAHRGSIELVEGGELPTSFVIRLPRA